MRESNRQGLPDSIIYSMVQVNRSALNQQVLSNINLDNKVPGSGYYNAELYLSNNGKYSNSKYKGGTQAKFSRTSRATFIDETKNSIKNMPGPGFYKAPSEFGQYDGNVYGASALGRFANKHRWVFLIRQSYKFIHQLIS